MEAIKLKAHAKINLSLDVEGKRQDGYHNVIMIMQTLELHDIVTVKKTPEGIKVTADNPALPSNEDNIAYKAAELFFRVTGIKGGADINLKKNIPVSAGLGGGSSNAASVLKGLDKLYNTGFSLNELIDTGERIGADVPFFMIGGTVLAQGKGEILTALSKLPKAYIVLVNPGFEVSTALVYKEFTPVLVNERPDTKLLLNAVNSGKMDLAAKNMKNVLEKVTAKRYPVICLIKTRLLELGALGSIMSGSGPTVFGIFNKSSLASCAYELIRNNGWRCWLTTTI